MLPVNEGGGGSPLEPQHRWLQVVCVWRWGDRLHRPGVCVEAAPPTTSDRVMDSSLITHRFFLPCSIINTRHLNYAPLFCAYIHLRALSIYNHRSSETLSDTATVRQKPRPHGLDSGYSRALFRTTCHTGNRNVQLIKKGYGIRGARGQRQRAGRF